MATTMPQNRAHRKYNFVLGIVQMFHAAQNMNAGIALGAGQEGCGRAYQEGSHEKPLSHVASW
jgi:hypothetical protein